MSTNTSMDTVSQRLAEFEADGYEHQYRVDDDGRLLCSDCNRVIGLDEVTVSEFARFEGESNPDDEAAIFALSTEEGPSGTLTVSFGADLSGHEADVVRALSQRRPT